jgi:hypothetical protein
MVSPTPGTGSEPAHPSMFAASIRHDDVREACRCGRLCDLRPAPAGLRGADVKDRSRDECPSTWFVTAHVDSPVRHERPSQSDA